MKVERSEGPKNERAKLNEKLENRTEKSLEGMGVTTAVTTRTAKAAEAMQSQRAS